MRYPQFLILNGWICGWIFFQNFAKCGVAVCGDPLFVSAHLVVVYCVTVKFAGMPKGHFFKRLRHVLIDTVAGVPELIGLDISGCPALVFSSAAYPVVLTVFVPAEPQIFLRTKTSVPVWENIR